MTSLNADSRNTYEQKHDPQDVLVGFKKVREIYCLDFELWGNQTLLLEVKLVT